jgi:Arc/MetJ-type ribon-helix-helix transcriptional regulator
MYGVSMTSKSRLSVTVDADLIAASQAAVAAGEAESVSAWVNDALRLKVEHDRRLRGIDDFIAAYEAEYGEITDEEMDAAYRAMKGRAIVVRGGQPDDSRRPGVA